MALKLRQKLGYGVGHVLNDLCSAVWFTYLLIFFHRVLQFNNNLAGLVLLIGQVADALSTPFVGHEADRVDDLPFCAYYGRRKSWHLLGCFCVVAAFPFIFLGCMGCTSATDAAQVIYFAPFVIVFQFGWAATQISHLSLIPTLTQDPHERTELNAVRYGFTVMSNITVYIIMWLVLGLDSVGSHQAVGPEDAANFRNVALIIVAIGIIFVSVFHLVVEEDRETSYGVISVFGFEAENGHKMLWSDWLRCRQFYQVAALYTGTRLYCNLSQAYVPIYLQDSLQMHEESVAYIPLVMYVSGFMCALLMKCTNKLVGRKVTFIMGALFSIAACLCIFWGHMEMDIYMHYLLYGVATLIGAGGSIMLVTSMTITADLIGANVQSGAFVYGAMSFSDKLANGIVVMAVQYWTPCMNDCIDCHWYFRYVLTFVCGGAAMLSLIALLTLLASNIGYHPRVIDNGPHNFESETDRFLPHVDTIHNGATVVT